MDELKENLPMKTMKKKVLLIAPNATENVSIKVYSAAVPNYQHIPKAEVNVSLDQYESQKVDLLPSFSYSYSASISTVQTTILKLCRHDLYPTLQYLC